MSKKHTIDEIIAMILLIVMTTIALLQILFRFVLNWPLDWSEEVIRYSLIMLVYVATILVIKEDKMIRVEIIDLFVKGKARDILYLFINTISGVFMLYLSYLSTFLVRNSWRIGQATPALQMPIAFLYSLEVITVGIMGIMFLKNVYKKCKVIGKGE